MQSWKALSTHISGCRLQKIASSDSFISTNCKSWFYLFNDSLKLLYFLLQTVKARTQLLWLRATFCQAHFPPKCWDIKFHLSDLISDSTSSFLMRILHQDLDHDFSGSCRTTLQGVEKPLMILFPSLKASPGVLYNAHTSQIGMWGPRW